MPEAPAAPSRALDGRRFVITGGAAGIGRATAALAVQRGAIVTIADKDWEQAQTTAAELRANGAVVHAVRCDVADPEDVRASIARAGTLMGGIDTLHCNAGITDAIAAADPSLGGLTVDAWDAVYAVNVRGVFLCVQAALPYLRESSRASVITAASIAADHARPRTLAYASSKAAVVAFTKGLALELAPDGIRVNGYSPGMVRTEMAERYLAAGKDPAALLRKVLENYLTSDVGRPEDVAEVVCFLAGDEARFVNGTVVNVDGGFAAFKATAAERAIADPAEGGGS